MLAARRALNMPEVRGHHVNGAQINVKQRVQRTQDSRGNRRTISVF